MFQSIKLAEGNRSQLTGAGGPTSGSSVRGFRGNAAPRGSPACGDWGVPDSLQSEPL